MAVIVAAKESRGTGGSAGCMAGGCALVLALGFASSMIVVRLTKQRASNYMQLSNSWAAGRGAAPVRLFALAYKLCWTIKALANA